MNGVESKISKGLEISNIALVDAKTLKTYTLQVNQIVPSKLMESETTSIDQFISHLSELKSNYPSNSAIPLPKHIVADGFYSKKKFVSGVRILGFELISKFRSDANLSYLYEEPLNKKRGRGRPKKYGDKVKLNDLSSFKVFETDVNTRQVKLYSQKVWSVNLKRVVKIVVVQEVISSGNEKFRSLLFSTDLSLSSEFIFSYYRSRFQIEFTFRDAKQHLGLEDCQARDSSKLNFHFNSSFSALNYLRLVHSLENPEIVKPFSVSSYRRRYSARSMLKLILCKLEISQNGKKIKTIYDEISNYGSIAA